MITTTGGTIVTSTLKLIGVLAEEEVPSAALLRVGFDALNGMIDNWGTARQTMLSIARYELDLVSNQQSYTIGDGGDFDLEPPLEIDHIGLIYPGTTPQNEQPIALLTDDQYSAIILKTMENPLPQYAFYSRSTAGLGTFYFWPGPNQDLTIALYIPVAVTQFSNPTEEVTLAAGYLKALRYNLAVELYPEFGTAPREDVTTMANKSLADIKRANFRPDDLMLDPNLMGYRGLYNIFSDTSG